MSVKYKDYPVYSYDEPATYEDFRGGINSDPSNEHLLDNEMRDCINMTYLSGALVKRKGAKKICNVNIYNNYSDKTKQEIINVQGTFLYTNNNPSTKVTYLIVAGDGKLYAGVYRKDGRDINLTRLHITRTYKRGVKVLDETNPWIGLNVFEEEQNNIEEGYIIRNITRKNENKNNYEDTIVDELIFQTTRPIEATTINEQNNDQLNNLYIATGTRIVKLYIKDEILYATGLDPYILNGTEMNKIGPNYISPYPEQAIGTQLNTVTTSIYSALKIDPVYVVDDDGNLTPKIKYTLEPPMNFQTGDNPKDYYYKWEVKDNNTQKWYTILTFYEQFAKNIMHYWDEIKVEEKFTFNTKENLEGYHLSILDEKGNNTTIKNGNENIYYFPDKQDIPEYFSLNNYFPNENIAYEKSIFMKDKEKEDLIYSKTSIKNITTYIYSKVTGSVGRTFSGSEGSLLIRHIITNYSDISNGSTLTKNGITQMEKYCNKELTCNGVFKILNEDEKVVEKNVVFKIKILSETKSDRTIYYVDHLDIYENKTELIVHIYEFTHTDLIGRLVAETTYITYPKKIYQVSRDTTNDKYCIEARTPFTHTTSETSKEYPEIQINSVLDIEKSIENLTIYAMNHYNNWAKKIDPKKWTNDIAFEKEDVVNVNGKYYKCIQKQPGNTFEEFKDADKKSYNTITVNDVIDNERNPIDYRVTFAKSFEPPADYLKQFEPSIGENKKPYHKGDYVAYGTKTYKLLINLPEGQSEFVTHDSNNNTIWELVSEIKEVDFKKISDVTSSASPVEDSVTSDDSYYKVYDFVVDKIDGEYFGQASTAGLNLDSFKDSEGNYTVVNDTFTTIHSCTKVISDGNKLLFYGDKYNTGWWFKSIVSNPAYITDRGCLSFKTTKNEEVKKVVPFQGNIIVFANNDKLGGSIHLVSGNGDDYDGGDGYYSPYKRKTINSSVSCSNENSIQVCDNILVFKYFDRVYYIAASDLNSDVVTVYSCNDRVKTNRDEYAIQYGSKSHNTNIPWDEDDCISEVTDQYYALMWPQKISVDEHGDEYEVHPAIRAKMYYKMANQLKDGQYTYPWLKDIGNIFNVRNIINIEGNPIYFFGEQLVSMHEDNYNDLGEQYICKIRLRGVDLNYPKLYKLISNVILYYHRNQYRNLDIKTYLQNEAGYEMLDLRDNRYSAGDLRALRLGAENQIKQDAGIKIGGATILDTRVVNPSYKFPCMLVDTTIEATCPDGVFSLSSVTFNYTTIDAPDTTPINLYSSIIRPKEL